MKIMMGTDVVSQEAVQVLHVTREQPSKPHHCLDWRFGSKHQ